METFNNCCHIMTFSKLAGTTSPGTSTCWISAHSIKFLTAYLVLLSVFTGTTPLAACTICSSVHGEAYRLWLSSLDKGFIFRFRLKSLLFCSSAGRVSRWHFQYPTLCHFHFLCVFCSYRSQSLTSILSKKSSSNPQSRKEG